MKNGENAPPSPIAVILVLILLFKRSASIISPINLIVAFSLKQILFMIYFLILKFQTIPLILSLLAFLVLKLSSKSCRLQSLHSFFLFSFFENQIYIYPFNSSSTSTGLQQFSNLFLFVCFCFCFFCFWPHHLACRIFIEPMPPAVEGQNLNHWTAREVPTV